MVPKIGAKKTNPYRIRNGKHPNIPPQPEVEDLTQGMIRKTRMEMKVAMSPFMIPFLWMASMIAPTPNE
jgi:hypothetical protein